MTPTRVTELKGQALAKDPNCIALVNEALLLGL